MVDSWCSAERGWDVEAFAPTLITFILLCKLGFKSIIKGGYKMAKECLFWETPYLLCVVTTEEGCMDLIYGIPKDVWFEVCIQNCSAVFAVFHMEYSWVKGQYCEVSMVLSWTCRWWWIWSLIDLRLIVSWYIWGSKSLGKKKGSNLYLMDLSWLI